MFDNGVSNVANAPSGEKDMYQVIVPHEKINFK